MLYIWYIRTSMVFGAEPNLSTPTAEQDTSLRVKIIRSPDRFRASLVASRPNYDRFASLSAFIVRAQPLSFGLSVQPSSYCAAARYTRPSERKRNSSKKGDGTFLRTPCARLRGQQRKQHAIGVKKVRITSYPFRFAVAALKLTPNTPGTPNIYGTNIHIYKCVPQHYCSNHCTPTVEGHTASYQRNIRPQNQRDRRKIKRHLNTTPRMYVGVQLLCSEPSNHYCFFIKTDTPPRFGIMLAEEEIYLQNKITLGSARTSPTSVCLHTYCSIPDSNISQSTPTSSRAIPRQERLP